MISFSLSLSVKHKTRGAYPRQSSGLFLGDYRRVARGVSLTPTSTAALRVMSAWVGGLSFDCRFLEAPGRVTPVSAARPRLTLTLQGFGQHEP